MCKSVRDLFVQVCEDFVGFVVFQRLTSLVGFVVRCRCCNGGGCKDLFVSRLVDFVFILTDKARAKGGGRHKVSVLSKTKREGNISRPGLIIKGLDNQARKIFD